MEEDVTSEISCQNCKMPVYSHHRYCYNCGNYLADDPVTINVFNNSDLRTVFFFYFIYLFICLVVKHSSWFRNYDQLFWVEFVLAVITIWYAWCDREMLKPLLRFNNFKWSRLIGIIVIAAVGSAAISYSIRELNSTYFNAQVSYYSAFSSYSFPIVIMIYSVAIVPAIFEELAFRGILFDYCSKFLDDRMVVAVTAFLFAIIHLTLVSLVWLLPFGFFIGHLRRRYNTLWYSIIFHFIFNLTACMFDLYKEELLFF